MHAFPARPNYLFNLHFFFCLQALMIFTYVQFLGFIQLQKLIKLIKLSALYKPSEHLSRQSSSPLEASVKSRLFPSPTHTIVKDREQFDGKWEPKELQPRKKNQSRDLTQSGLSPNLLHRKFLKNKHSWLSPIIRV